MHACIIMHDGQNIVLIYTIDSTPKGRPPFIMYTIDANCFDVSAVLFALTIDRRERDWQRSALPVSSMFRLEGLLPMWESKYE